MFICTISHVHSISKDTHVSLNVIFTIPEGKTAEDYTDKFYAASKAANKSIYYGFATNGNKLLCRQGYQNAEDFFAYIKLVVSGQLSDGLQDVTILISGPRQELDKIRPKVDRLPARITFAELDGDNMVVRSLPESSPDTHVTILPEFTVPQGRMEEFNAVKEKFYSAAKNGTKKCLYYGFAMAGDKVWCREGYTGSRGVLEHIGEVMKPMNKLLNIVGGSGVKLNLVGPASELNKLRRLFSHHNADFWELDSRAYWK